MVILLLLLPVLFLEQAGKPLCDRTPMLAEDVTYCRVARAELQADIDVYFVERERVWKGW